MQEAQASQTFKSWYQDRFNSNPYSVLRDAFSEISRIADDLDHDWSHIADQVELKRQSGKSAKVTETVVSAARNSGYKHTVGIYANVKQTRGGHEYPVITFSYKGGAESQTFNGYQYLRELYEREAHIVVSDSEKEKRRKRLEKQERERQAKLAEAKAKAEAEAKKRQESVERDKQLWETLSTDFEGYLSPASMDTDKGVSMDADEGVSTDADQGVSTDADEGVSTDTPYAKRKNIAEILTGHGIELRWGQDNRGTFLALRLHDSANRFRGLQKIYNKKFPIGNKGKKTDKSYTWGMDKTGAHVIIGDLAAAIKNHTPIIYTEGFATGGTLRLALDEVVVVTMDAPNLKEVVAEYSKLYPNNPHRIGADNDMWKCEEGKGNTGMLTALDLCKAHPNVKAKYPHFDNMDGKPTDWNDIHVNHHHGLHEVKRQWRRKINTLHPKNKLFDFRLQRMAYVGEGQAAKAAEMAVSAGMMMCPMMHSATEIIELVTQAAVSTGKMAGVMKKLRPDMLKQVEKAGYAKMNEAKASRSFSQKTRQADDVNYIKIADNRNEKYGNQELPDDIVKRVKALHTENILAQDEQFQEAAEQGKAADFDWKPTIVIVRSPMGSAKTQKLLAPLMRESDAALYLAHRVSLIADACEHLSEKDAYGNYIKRVDNYQDVKRIFAATCQRVGCCINSITSPNLEPFMPKVETTLGDEASQVLRAIADGTINNPVAVLDKLSSIIANSKLVVMTDADANDALVNFIRQAVPGATINIMEMATDCSHIQVLHSTDLMAHQHVMKSCKAGKKVLVADDSANDGSALKDRIELEVPGTKVLHVHGNSKGDPDVMRFLNNPDEEKNRWDVLIYSPAISSGVSMQTKHFDEHVGIFFGVVSPSDAAQMLRRDRSATRYVIGFHLHDRRKETDRDKIWEGRVISDRMAMMDKYEIDAEFEETDDYVVKRWHKSPFDNVWLNCIETERKAANDFANYLLMILIGDKYQVSRLDRDCIEEERAAEGKKRSKANVTERRHNLIKSQAMLTPAEAETLRRREAISEEEKAALDRYTIESELCVKQLDDQAIAFFEDRGLNRLRRFEALQADYDVCATFDNHLADKGVTASRRIMRAATHHFYRKMFDGLGIDLKTGQGAFNADQCREVMKSMLSSPNAILAYNETGVGPVILNERLPKCATTWVKNVLGNLGLRTLVRKVGQAKIRHHFVNPETWAEINGYYKRRQKLGVSSLTIQEDIAEANPEQAEQQPAQADTAPAAIAPAVTACGTAPVVAGAGLVEGGAGYLDSINTLFTKPLHLKATNDGGLANSGININQGEMGGENAMPLHLQRQIEMENAAARFQPGDSMDKWDIPDEYWL